MAFASMFSPRDSKSATIVIIGAGMSGVSAAEQLYKYNFKNITILEASDRVGGRLHSVHFESGEGSNYLEMGSQRIESSTLIGIVAERNNQIYENSPDYTEALNTFCPVYGRSGISAIRNFVSYLVKQPWLHSRFSDMNYFEDSSFTEMCLNSVEPDIRKALISYMEGIHNWWWYSAYEFTLSRYQKELISGYSGLLQHMLCNIHATIIPNKEVIAINWSQFQNLSQEESFTTPKIIIKCQDDSIFEADHVVIAIPLGYLKENYKTLFIPSLPEDKIIAIEDLPFITVNKIFLEFEEPFWIESDVFHVIWSEKMSKLYTATVHENSMDPTKWVKYINRFEYVYSNRNCICAWIFDEGAKLIENLPKDEIARNCVILLEYLTMSSISQPLNVITTTWNSNRLFRGSIVYDLSRSFHCSVRKYMEAVSINEKQETRSHLFKVTRIVKKPLLLFTGDVGFMDTQSSVEGARECGIRAATELERFYNPPLFRP